MVIVIYFVFVLLVGLWVSSIHFIKMKNTFTFTIIMITITIFSSLSSSLYISGLMAIEEKQCWRILPRIAVDALDARWCESLCFKHWVGRLFDVWCHRYHHDHHYFHFKLWFCVFFKFSFGGRIDQQHDGKV